MNKIRSIGLVVLAIGIIIHFAIEHDASDFTSGILIGVGIGLLLTGKISKPSISQSSEFEQFSSDEVHCY